jgi:TusE/DsrC/DsvC family sulfur relay protein
MIVPPKRRIECMNSQEDSPMSIQIDGKTLETDEEGFLLDPSEWNETVAQKIAEGEALTLDDGRWIVVRFVREHFEERHTVPEARTLLKVLSEKLGKNKGTRKYLHELFPYGYGQQACKIAGMRKPRKLMLDV